MKKVDDFISVYNEYLKEKANRFDDVELILKKEGLNDNSFKSPIQYFLEAFKFPSVYNYSGFCFINRPAPTSDDFIHFATHIDYSLLYVHCISDGKVYLWDQEYDRIEWSCSESLSVFFESMSAIMQTKIKMLQTGTYDLDQEYLRSVFRYCLTLNDNKEEYKTFYEHLLGIDTEG
ncbi:hypothetical protein [Chryseosolibacter indicus]|uniref:SMI1/KNR4 family protein n=1 Tax=Chryseosolibacter indicus TaxID=2782351 RepID=A0ABS5VXB0_9BACT|nr:hypothetical protein [Chryseosolibacter indicus]MBT1705379.1 hypothetical protein [Chryseosolibacter indicus]